MSITIKDIARMAEVSITTVSKILNNKDANISEATRIRVKQIIKENNYTPNKVARSMVTKKTKTIGLIIPDVRNPFFTELVRGSEDKANELGYSIMFCNTDEKIEKEIQYMKILMDRMVDGIILAPSVSQNLKLTKNLNVTVPMVTLDRTCDYEAVAAKIMIDNYSGALDAINYLLDQGHKKIAYISGPIDAKPSIDRQKAMLDALEKRNISMGMQDIYIGSFSYDWGKIMAERLCKEGFEYTAFFCGNDLIAAGFMKTMIKNGYKVPEDISIIGFDDIELASVIEPELTTVFQPNYEMGYRAAEMIIQIIEEQKSKVEDLVLIPELRVRNSTR